MADFSKIGTSMINMEDVSDYLKVAQGFITNLDDASDTNKVAGIASKYIAVADQSKRNTDGSILVDRETIKNSLHLDGHAADYFATKDFANDLTSSALDIKNNYNKEISQLRDEMYQMRTELTKKGLLNHFSPYSGFYDTFRSGTTMHLADPVATNIEDSPSGADGRYSLLVNDSFFDTVEIGDYLFLSDKNSGNTAMISITEKKDDHKTLRITPGTTFDMKQGAIDIYRSRGTILNGSFSFGAVDGNRVSDDKQLMYTGLDDDTYSKVVQINNNAPGYAYTFRIPKRMQKNYLSKLDIMVKVTGDPGTLICYVIREKDIQKYNDLRTAAIKGQTQTQKNADGTTSVITADDLVVGKSSPLKVNASLGMHLESFQFYNGDNIKNSNYGMATAGAYPLLSEQDDETGLARYCFILEPQGTLDANNYFTIELISNALNGDLQTNNNIYRYNKATEQPLTKDDDLSKMDFYYGVWLLKAMESTFRPLDEGIYSARFEEPSKITSTRARLTMRINREGLFDIEESGNFGDQATLSVVKGKNVNYLTDFSNLKGRHMVIGSNICTVEDADQTGKIVVAKGLHVDAKSPVYPIGYDITLKAYYDEWDPDKCATFRRYGKKFSMPLTAVMVDKIKTDDTASDRLIFEADLREDDGKLKPYNKYELEIHWKKSCANNAVTDTVNGVTVYPLTAAIRDLSLSLDHIL